MNTLSDNKLNEIRRLLIRFYDGESSPEDISRLNAFFANTDAERLPEDMREDSETFRLMAVEAESLEAQAPDGLEDAIRDIIGKESKKAHIIRFTPWISAAAVAIAIFILTVLPVWKTDETTHSGLTASQSPSNGSITTAKPVSYRITGLGVNNNANSITAVGTVEGSGNSIEINDPEEAARITAEALLLLRDKMTFVHNSIGEKDKHIRNINTSIKRILENEKI